MNPLPMPTFIIEDLDKANTVVVQRTNDNDKKSYFTIPYVTNDFIRNPRFSNK